MIDIVNNPNNNRSNHNNKTKKKFKQNKNSYNRKITTTDILVGETLNRMTKGNLDIQEQPFEISYNKIYSDKTKMVLQIVELKRELDYGYVETLKEKLRRQCGNLKASELDILSVQYCKHNKVVFTKKSQSKEASIQSALKHLEERKQIALHPELKFNAYIREQAQYDPRLASSIKAQEGTRYELDQIEKEKERLLRKKYSYDMIHAYQNEGGTCLEVYNFIEIVAVNQEIAQQAMEILQTILYEEGYITREVTDLEQYQIAFAPTSLRSLSGKGKKEYEGMPYLSLSNTIPMTQRFRPGILRSKSPEMYIGHNMENNYRVDVSFTDSITKENYLVVGDTKSGKSLFLKTALLTWLDNHFANVIVKEYKGKGWNKFGEIFGEQSSIISLDIDNPKFINTYKIPTLSDLQFQNPFSAYMLCHNITTKTLLTLINGHKSPTDTQVSLCQEIVTRVLSRAGVNETDPTTYKYSHSINFITDTWIGIDEVSRDVDMRGTYNTQDMSIIKQNLSTYFSPNGIKRSIFGRELHIDEMLFKTRVLIFDYSTNSISSSESSMENELAMRILQQSFLENLYCNYNSHKGKYTVVVTEEIDEQVKNPYILQEIRRQWDNSSFYKMINFATVKNLDLFFNVDEVSRNALQPSGFIVGNCTTRTLNLLKENTELVTLGDTLNNVCSNKSLTNAFLIYNTYKRIPTCITKMPLTKDLILSLENVKDSLAKFI